MKFKLTLICALIGAFSGFAQSNEALEASAPGTPNLSENAMAHMYDMSKANIAKRFSSPFPKNMDMAITSAQTNSKVANNSIVPFAQIQESRWGLLDKVTHDAQVLFSTKRVGNDLHFKTFDSDINIDKQFSVAIPASTNNLSVINHYSTHFFNNDNKVEFMVYLHHFDPNLSGPESQLFSIWIINEDGDVLQKVTGSSAWAKFDNQGNKRFYTYLLGNTGATIKSYDLSTYNVTDSYTINFDLINFFAGVPVQFMTIDGQERFVIAHYEKLFMDNATMQVYPNNHLIVKILDFDFTELKSMSFDIQTAYPNAGSMVIPQATFGTFYRDNQYDISKHTFNSDNTLEVVYGIQYYDMLNDITWYNFRLADETGTILKSLEKYIVGKNYNMTSLAGHDNQLGFLLSTSPESDATKLGFFDIESWTMVTTLEAIQPNGDRLSNRFNRIADGNSYHYLVGIGSSDEENGNVYGVVDEFKKDGTLVSRHRLPIANDALLFSPVLTSNALKPNVFTTASDSLYFFYAYLQPQASGGNLRTAVIASDENNILVTFPGTTPKGDVNGAGIIPDISGQSYDKLYVTYLKNTSDSMADFYKLPLTTSLGIEDVLHTNFSVYPNPSANFITIQSNTPVNRIQIYSMTGQLVLDKVLSSKQSRIDISNLATGVYVSKVSLDNGQTQTLKLIKE